MPEFVKSEFDKRLETINDLIFDYFQEIGPPSVTECCALVGALNDLWMAHKTVGYMKKFKEKNDA
jgi:hypothetical protein